MQGIYIRIQDRSLRIHPKVTQVQSGNAMYISHFTVFRLLLCMSLTAAVLSTIPNRGRAGEAARNRYTSPVAAFNAYREAQCQKRLANEVFLPNARRAR